MKKMKKYPAILSVLLILALFPGCNNYGTEKTFDGVELYHTDKVTVAETDQLGDYLVKQKFANGDAKSVQLSKNGDTYQFRFVVKEGVEKDTAFFKTIKLFGSMLSAQVFNGAPLEVDLCDDQFKTLKVLMADDYGKEKIFNSTSIFHAKNITGAEVDSLGNYLVSSKFADGKPKSIMLTKMGDIYQFKFVIKNGLEKSADYLQNTKIFASELSKGAFHGAPVEILLCDDNFSTLVVVPMGDSTR